MIPRAIPSALLTQTDTYNRHTVKKTWRMPRDEICHAIYIPHFSFVFMMTYIADCYMHFMNWHVSQEDGTLCRLGKHLLFFSVGLEAHRVSNIISLSLWPWHTEASHVWCAYCQLSKRHMLLHRRTNVILVRLNQNTQILNLQAWKTKERH